MKVFLIISLIIFGLVLLLFFICLIITNIVYNTNIKRTKPRHKKKKKTINQQWLDIFNESNQYIEKLRPTLETVSITSSKSLKLKGYLKKQNDGKLWIITLHGWKSSALFDVSLTSKFFFDEGYNVLSVDHQAHGESEGEIIGFGILDYIELLKWCNYLINRFGHDIKIFLTGVSMGASTVLYTTNKNLPNNVKGVIADCGFTSPYDEFKYLLNNSIHLPKWPFMPLIRMEIKSKAHYDILESTIDCVKNAKVPILYICGDKDNFVPLEFTLMNYDNTTSEKELLIIEGASHAMSYYTNPVKYKEKVLDFINKYEDKS